jgi:hypothetical protein
VRGIFFDCLDNSEIDPTYYLVEDYFIKLNLRKLGIESSFDDLSEFEVRYLSLIASEVGKLEQQQAKKKGKK